MKLLVICFLIEAVIAWDISASGNLLSCVYTDEYNSLTNSELENIINLCNHFVYYTAAIDLHKGLVIEDKKNFSSIKSLNKNIKLLLYITAPTSYEERITILYENDQIIFLINLIIRQLRSYDFDGICLNSGFAFIRDNAGKSAVVENFVKKFSEEFHEEAITTGSTSKLILTMDSSRINHYIAGKVNMVSLIDYLDYMYVSPSNVYNPSTNGHVNHLRPLYNVQELQYFSDSFYTQDDMVNYFLDQGGVESRKLILVLSSLCSTFTLKNSSISELGAPSKGSGSMDKFPSSICGLSPFFEVCDKIRNEIGWNIKYINKSALGPIAIRGDQWISYDDIEMIKTKTKYAMSKYLGGVSININADDYSGNCYNKKFPLTKAAKSTLSQKINAGMLSNFDTGSCEKPKIENSIFTCFANKRQIPCTEILPNGSVIRFECEIDFRPLHPTAYNEVTCKNGKWNHPLIKCIAKCGSIQKIQKKSPSLQALIFKGTEETFGYSPWNVAIYSFQGKPRSNPGQICGGTIIRQRIIVSAAHCFYNNVLKEMRNASNYIVAVAKETRNYEKKDNDYQRVYEIKEIRTPDKFLGSDLNYLSDIVLLIMEEKIEFNDAVKPACIDVVSEFSPIDGVLGKVAGWGLDTSGFPSELLLTAKLPYMKQSTCQKELGKEHQDKVTPDKFCVNNKNGQGVRVGDSGAGLMFHDENNSLYYLRGVVSTRPIINDSNIGMFTDISYQSHSNWIKKVIQEIDTQNS